MDGKIEVRHDGAPEEVFHSHELSTRDGLLCVDGHVVSLPYADTMARKCGYQWAEQLVRELEFRMYIREIPRLGEILEQRLGREPTGFELSRHARRVITADATTYTWDGAPLLSHGSHPHG